MYFKDITDEELNQFHRKIHVDYKIQIKNIFYSDLFEVEDMGSLLRIVPLFYFDNFTSSNPNDIIMDNQVIICEYLNDTVLKFNTNDNSVDIGFGLQIYDKNDYIICYFYDFKTGKPLSDVNCHISLLYSDHPGSSHPFIIDEFDMKGSDGGVLYYYYDPEEHDYEEEPNGYTIIFSKNDEELRETWKYDWRTVNANAI